MANTLKFGNGEWYGKEDTILAYNDENKNFKPLPFDFERGSVATRINKEGLIETVGTNEPRVDYKDNVKGAMILEPTRTNLVTYSEDFTNAAWTKDNISVSKSGTLANGLAKHTLTPDTNSNVIHAIYDTYSNTSNKVTASVFVDVTNSDFDYIAMSIIRGSNSTGSGVIVDLSNGLITSHLTHATTTKSVDFVDYGNGIVKVSLTVERTDASYPDYILFSPHPTATVSSWSNGYRMPNFTSNGTDIFVCSAAMVEAGSYPTSYIPTQGTVQTRLADSCSQTPPDGVIGQTEGTMYAEAKINGLKDSNTIFTLHNGSFSEYLVIAGNSSGNITAYIFAGGVQQAAIFGGIYAVGSIVKCAMAYKQNDVAFYINGVLIGTDTSATMASTSVFDVGSISFGNYPLNGSVKQAQLYNTRLSNSELQALTQV